MDHKIRTAPATPAAEALAILDEAYAYYRPEPKLVSVTNSAPAPVISEYYAA
ncbi:hypothetical protein [Marivita sp. GX14005]|uniref:hypothetical protein n=1 Tax=Marivita sp. GX14005 TaxID=2942276 RepID=UPI002018D42A|nr:hypothetical protein [Marivita sp. GX14005]MCL3882228.1 hypothetical protein [Marivita sp. GX14005]